MKVGYTSVDTDDAESLGSEYNEAPISNEISEYNEAPISKFSCLSMSFLACLLFSFSILFFPVLDFHAVSTFDYNHSGTVPTTLKSVTALANSEDGSFLSCEDAATSLIAKLRSQLQDIPYVVIVGGIGDSGTRAVFSFLTDLGIDLGEWHGTRSPSSDVTDTMDSKAWMDIYKTTSCLPVNNPAYSTQTNARMVYLEALSTLHTLDFGKANLTSDMWFRGLQFTSLALLARLEVHNKNGRTGLYGFKHPRSSLMLPFFQHILGSRLKFVHVVRDGRDVAGGANQLMFKSLCSVYNGRTCVSYDKRERLEFWGKTNLEVHDFASGHLGAGHYYSLRIEDLVNGEKDCLFKLSEMLDVSEADYHRIVTEPYLDKNFRSHKHSYFGNKFSYRRNRLINELAKNASHWCSRAVEKFGYTFDLTPAGFSIQHCSQFKRF